MSNKFVAFDHMTRKVRRLLLYHLKQSDNITDLNTGIIGINNSIFYIDRRVTPSTFIYYFYFFHNALAIPVLLGSFYQKEKLIFFLENITFDTNEDS